MLMMKIYQLVVEYKVFLFLFAVFWSTVFHIIYSYYWNPTKTERTATVDDKRGSRGVNVHLEDPVFGHAGEVIS